MNTDNNKFLLSVYAKKPVSRKRRLNDDNENGDFNKQSNIQLNYKRQKVGLNIPLLEKITENERNENERNENEVKNELNDEKKNDEINEENVWKKSRKIRRQYLCVNFPTLVITPVKGRMLLSESSLIKFMGLDAKIIRPRINAHTHSASWRTLY
ncbi:hypothetical protein RFI_40389, partial [Reticulomyxa filosa]